MSILINKNTARDDAGHHRQDRHVPHRRPAAPTPTARTCYVAGVNPKKAGENFEGIPIFGTVKDAKAKTGANVSVIYVPPPFAAAAIGEAVDADLDLVICITEGIPVRDMIAVRDRMRRSKRSTLLVGPNCPGVITPGRDQDRHHAGPHPQEGPRRRGVALGHAHLRGGRPAHRARHRPVELRRHRRRPGQRPEAHRRAEAVQRRPGHRRGDHDRRDRRLRRGRRGALGQGAT